MIKINNSNFPKWTQLIPAFYLLCIAILFIWFAVANPIPVEPYQTSDKNDNYLLDNLLIIIGN